MLNKIKLLFLAANPVEVPHLRLGQEIREIEEKILSAPHARSFEVISKFAVRPQDLVTSLMRHRPNIVHFSGHARANEIILEDDDGNMRPVSKEQLESIFSVFNNTIRLVMLNACYSEAQLAGFSRIIDYAVGTSSVLGDQAAIEFAACFYQSLAFAHSIPEAFELAKCQVSISHTESEIFALHIREGVNSSEPFIERKGKRVRASRSDLHSTTITPEGRVEPVTPDLQQARLTESNDPTSSQRAVSSINKGGLPPSDKQHRTVSDLSGGETPPEIRKSLQKFRADYPDPGKVAFLMMRFGKTKAHANIVAGIRKALEPIGIRIVRADDKQYHDDLFPNVLTYMYGCGFGIAVFERIETEEFNPNVALEVGYMFALQKNICLLKDKTLQTLQADLVGKLYRIFDSLDPIETIPSVLTPWLRDKALP